MKRFAVGCDPLTVAPIEELVCDEARGAVVTFQGVVRRTSDDARAVVGLVYEAHETMAVDAFETIAREASERFDGCVLAIHHRIGRLLVGEVAVVVVAAAAHRSRAFDACRYAIDALKAHAPIWKREVYVDGSGAWKSNA